MATLDEDLMARKDERLRYTFRAILSWILFCSFFTVSVWAGGDETPANSDRATGAVNESFQTNLFTGSFSHSIPIAVPPGTKLQPTLALTYNSSAVSTQTILGTGWSLSGLGSIERSTKKGVPTYSSSDTYILNLGSTHDLISVPSDANSPYHTKLETFLRIQSVPMTYPDPDPSKAFSTVYWIVTDKNGTQFRFGFNAGSNVVALGPGGTSRKVTRSWQLDRVTDTHGNYIEINYSQDTINGGIYPLKITYTKNDAAPINFFRTIDFTYESRSDVVTDYSSGALVRINQRLKAIDMRVNGTLVRQYQFAYALSPISGRSLFQSIQEIGSDAASPVPTSLPATNFTYQQNQVGWVKDNGWSGTIPDALLKDDKFNGVQIVDVNGDGLPDFIKSVSVSDVPEKQVWLNNGQGWSGPNSAWASTIPAFFLINGADKGLRLVDVNGDGRPDFIQSIGSSKAVWLNNGNGWDPDPSPTWSNSPFPFFLGAINGSGPVDQGVQIVDVNGDGLPDMVQNLLVETTETNKCQLLDPLTPSARCQDVSPGSFSSSATRGVWLNTGNGWGALDAGWTSKLPSEPLMKIIVTKTIASCATKTTYQQGDQINNQPIPFELVGATKDCQWTYFSNTTRPVDSWTRFFDANGDGLLDVISSLVDNNGAFIKKDVFLNYGQGWVRDSAYSDSIPKALAKQTSSSGYTTTGSQLVSLNGNRATDFVSFAPNGSGGSVFLNRFVGWQQQADTAWTGSLATTPNYRLTNDRQLAGNVLVDVNGDGLPDFVASILNATPVLDLKEVHLAKGPAPDLLIQVQNSAGGKTTIHYKPAAQYVGAAGEILNDKIPYPVQTVDSIVNDNGWQCHHYNDLSLFRRAF